jgi:hypothetical protein
MANDLVVQLGAKLDQFASDMNAAGDLADSAIGRIEDSFAKLNPGISVSNLAAGLAIAGGAAVALIGLVAALNTSLAETARAAERAGLSFERIQQLKFGANSIGVKDSDFSTSLDSFVSKLQDAKSKENDLKRVFDANGVTITESNGKLKDTNDLITKAVDIIKRAPSIQDALQIGSFLGISREFSQSIFDAGDNFLRLAAQANAAGAVIDDATIDKARIFDREWTKASALWGANLRAALGDILPLLNDAVSGALAVINAVKTAYSFISAIKDFAVAPNIETSSLNKLNSLLSQYEEIKRTLQAGQPLDPIQAFQASNIPAVDGKITVEEVQKVIDAIKAKIEGANRSLPRIVVHPDPSVNPGIKKPSEDRDAFEVAIDQTKKRVAVIDAETATIGQNTEARERAKVVAQLEEAAKRANAQAGKELYGVTEATNPKIGEQADKMLAAAKAAREQQTSFQGLNDAIRFGGNELVNVLDQATQKGFNFEATMASVMRNVTKQMLQAAITGEGAFAKLFGFSAANGGVGGLAGLLAGAFGKETVDPGSAARPLAGLTAADYAPGFASGTDSAPGGMAWVGENGKELMNVPQGTQIIPNDVLRKGGLGSGTQIHNTFMVAGEVSQGTVDRLQNAVVAAHRKADGLAKVFTSTQRMQLSGVG